MIETEHFEQVEVTSALALRRWLEKHHRQTESIWLVLHKKHSGAKYVSIDAILDELLCFGWVDGIARKLDVNRSLRFVSPRRVHHWAKTYKDRAERLIREGRMKPSGLFAISESKRRGLWDAMSAVDALVVPDDLARALKRARAARAFDERAPSYRRNVLRWIEIAKRPETRAHRIEALATLTAKGEKVPQM